MYVYLHLSRFIDVHVSTNFIQKIKKSLDKTNRLLELIVLSLSLPLVKGLIVYVANRDLMFL